MQEAMIRAYLALEDLKDRARRPVADQAGQTAAEYLGIVVVVAVIIGLLAQTQLGQTIADYLEQLAAEIFGGGR
jgi:Flp pilus assembly pilin Flp